MSRVGVAEPAYPDTIGCVLGAKHMANESQLPHIEIRGGGKGDPQICSCGFVCYEPHEMMAHIEESP